MAIIDEAHEIRQRLHRIKADEALVATGAALDAIGREYSIGRNYGSESDLSYAHRVWMRIMKVMTDAAAAEVERKRERDERSEDLVVLAVDYRRFRASTG